MLKAKRFILWLVMSLMLILAGCQSAAPSQYPPISAAPSQEAPTDVILMLDWVPNTNHTGIFVAQEKGWYEEAGLKVEIIQPGETYVEQVVATGSANFGISFQEAVTMARAEEAPLVSVAAVIQHNTSAFASRVERGIAEPKDFEGKNFGSYGSPAERPVIDLLMSCDGGASGDTVNFIDTGFADFLSITEGEVDFSWIFYGWEGIDAELKGVELNLIMLKQWLECVPDLYAPIIITSEKMIAEQPEIVKAFVSATAKGYEYAIANPDDAADILLKAAPETDAELTKASQKWLSQQYQADAPAWGVQKAEVWQNFADLLFDHGVLSEKLDTSSAFNNDFLPATK